MNRRADERGTTIMKTHRKILAVLPLAILAGCAVDAGDKGQEPEPNVTVDQALTTFEFDSRAVSTHPRAEIPSDRLSVKAFDSGNVIGRLIGSTEPFDRKSLLGTRVEYGSASWSLEEDPMSGQIFALKTKEPGPAVTLDEAKLQSMAISRLAAFGIPTTEIGRIRQTASMLQDQDGTVMGTPEIHRYKTFVWRAINGVPVQGHRAVISHAPDGSFHKALVRWPALASSGHKLRTSWGVAEIEKYAGAYLAREGETTGKVKLLWKYVATPTSSGEVVLTLKVSARMGGTVSLKTGVAEEPREVEVDVGAL
jgi:hypothetical protein